MSILETEYKTLCSHAAQDLKGEEVSHSLERLINLGLKFLSDSCTQLPIKSAVPSKRYFVFRAKGKPSKYSRPVNADLFDAKPAQKLVSKIASGALTEVGRTLRQKALYSAAMSYCCTTDLLKSDDKKTPGTFFEVFIGHLAALSFGINPQTSIQVLNMDQKTQLPTDFIFDLGPDKNKIHLPVKISTRERVVQVWAHQRVLDGVFGMNRFKGVLVCLTETNMQRKTMSVVEVCLPDQWAIYQMFIAQMHRIYYLDPPAKYAPLAGRYPFIQVKEFASFFDEIDHLVRGAPTG